MARVLCTIFWRQTKQIAIGTAYAQIQDYLATCGLYREASYRQWEPETKADPWLIAAAMVEGAIVVTNEQAAHPILSNPLKREPKIPTWPTQWM